MLNSRLVLPIALLATTACSFGPQLQRVAVNHNDIVANSNNELVLVNILRARDREPLHFTSVSKLSGDAQLQATGAANVAIKGPTPTVKTNSAGELVDTSTLAGTEVTTPSLQLGVNSKTSMDVAVWDTQEFYQGITMSVPASIIAHYLHQGWPSEFMTYAMVESVDFVATEKADGVAIGQRLGGYVNEPGVPAAGAAFKAFVQCYQLGVVQKNGTETRLVPLSRVKDLKLSDLALLDGEKFEIDGDKDDKDQPIKVRWIKRRGKGGDTLVLRKISQSPDCKQIDSKDKNRKEEITKKPLNIISYSSQFEMEREEHDGPNKVASGVLELDGIQVTFDVHVVLRSVDSLIYFLGEYIRAPKPAYAVSTSEGPVPLLTVTRSRPERVFVSTRYKDIRYYVPATDEGRLDSLGGRSSQMFSLVEQLLNLHKNAKDRPTTQTVRIQ